jgi:CelD/BcsL family acetyltransferase involved in cellulose biosynthesis
MGIADSVPEATRLVGTCLDMKSDQLRKIGHRNPFHDPGTRAFLMDYFGGRIAQDTWVAALHVGGQPAAIAFGFRDPQSWLLYQTAMTDGRLGRLSPGTHLLMHVLKHCCEQGVGEFDLSLGEEAYKAEWCERSATLMTEVFGISARGQIYSHLIRARVRASRWISSRPALYEIAKQAKGWIEAIRR